MISISNILDQSATIDQDLKVSSKDKDFKAEIEVAVNLITREMPGSVSTLAYVFYELQKQGYQVEADTEDLTDDNLQDNTVY